MEGFVKGDILVIEFPYSDLKDTKRRPVLILSKNSKDLIICGITSNLKDKKHSVLIDNSNLSEGKIPKQSLIKVNKLFTIEESIIEKKVAKLNKETFEDVKKEFYSLV